jgi:hypothetical protein
MNALLIILGIILIVMIYYIVSIFNAVPTVAKTVDLTKTPAAISPTTISDPYSVNYTVGVWVYVNQFTPQIGRLLMFGDKTYYGPQSLFSLRMDTQGNNLYADILVNKMGPAGATTTTPTILPVLLNVTQDSFPLQKWVYVAVSVSYNFVEAYLNGKFITAVNIHNNHTFGVNGIFQAPAPKDPNSGATFTFGGLGSTMDDGSIRQYGCPVMLSNVSRWNSPMTSGDIYNIYLKGNGQQSSIFGSSYHLNVNVTQDKNSYVLPVF